MGLRDIGYQEDYRSGYDNIVEDFFRPSLRVAKLYWRAVGYFSSSSLEAFGEPLGEFIRNGGQIRLVTSVELSEADLQAIADGAPRQGICAQRLEDIIETDFADGVGDGVARLARLLEIGRLQIQIAVPKTGTGIYHEKIGLFIDGDDYVAFTGSSNESRTAFENNRECVDVYSCWDSPVRAARKREHFETLWNRTDQGVEVYSFPDAARKKLLRVVGEWEANRRPDGRSQSDNGEDEGLWPHQKDAIAEFMEKRRGILEMATGTGKTRTALSILMRLIRSNKIQTAIIATDGNDLLDQWWGDVATALADTYPRFRLLRHYGPYHDRDEYLIDPDTSVLLCSRMALQGVLKRLDPSAKRDAVLIQDEVHRFGSASHVAQLDGLADEIPWRLGLSATPDREYDQDGNAFIERNVGAIIFQYPLEKAIADGILCGFDYVAIEWDPSDEDRHAVHALMRRRAASSGSDRPMSEEEFRREVARVYKTSIEKVPLFEQFVRSHPDALERCIVFVAEKAYGELVREHIHAITPRFHTYFDIDDSVVLREFATGIIDCLITCHRVSEGIDIRSVKTVVLLSADRARLETIQRIGRCLRIDHTNPNKRALVVDFIRTRADADGDPTADEERRVWLEQLSRIRRTPHVPSE